MGNKTKKSGDDDYLEVGEISVKDGNTFPCPGCGYEISHGVDGINDPNAPAIKKVVCPNCDLEINMDGYYLCNGCKERMPLIEWQGHLKNCSGLRTRLFLCPECSRDILLDDDELESYVSSMEISVDCPYTDCAEKIVLDEDCRKK